LVLMLSLMFGGSAALGVNKYVTNRAAGALATADAVRVVVATGAVPRGATLTADMVKLREYPRAMVLPGMLTRTADALNRAVFIPLVKDEPVLEGKLAPRGARSGMAALVPDGMRAFTILTPSVASGVGGFILPGNKVDVLLTLEGRRGVITTTLVQNLEILAVDQQLDAPSDNRVDPRQLRSVTLLVTPEQAARLGLAHNKGALHLALRNHSDERLLETPPARLAELDDADRTAAVPPAVAPPAKEATTQGRGRVITIYRGLRSMEQLRLGEVAARPVESASGENDSRGSELR
jgi:pilus assembly protein CpaB